MALRYISAAICLVIAVAMFAVGGSGGIVIGLLALLWAGLMIVGPR